MTLSNDIDEIALGCEDFPRRKPGWPKGVPRGSKKESKTKSASPRFRAAQGFMRLNEVTAAVGMGRSTIYRHIAAGEFPRHVELGLRNSQWIRSEVEAWIASKIAARDAGGKR